MTEVYHFLFETFQGIGVLLGAALIISIVACVIMERRAKKALDERHAALRAQRDEDDDDDDWDDDEDED